MATQDTDKHLSGAVALRVFLDAVELYTILGKNNGYRISTAGGGGMIDRAAQTIADVQLIRKVLPRGTHPIVHLARIEAFIRARKEVAKQRPSFRLGYIIPRETVALVDSALRLLGAETPESKIAGEQPSNSGYKAPCDYASEYNLPTENVRKALNTWRKNQPGSDGFIENTERKSTSPEFLYREDIVRPILQRLQGLRTRRELRRKKSSG